MTFLNTTIKYQSMLFKQEDDNRQLYFCTSADWECVVLANDSTDASRQAIQFALNELEENLMVSACLRIKKINSEFENSDELFRIDKIFADIGMYKESRSMSQIVKNLSK